MPVVLGTEEPRIIAVPVAWGSIRIFWEPAAVATVVELFRLQSSEVSFMPSVLIQICRSFLQTSIKANAIPLAFIAKEWFDDLLPQCCSLLQE